MEMDIMNDLSTMMLNLHVKYQEESRKQSMDMVEWLESGVNKDLPVERSFK